MRATNTTRWSLKVGQDLFTIFDIARGTFNLCSNGLVINTYNTPEEAALALWRGETGVKSWDDYLIGKEIPEYFSAWLAETK